MSLVKRVFLRIRSADSDEQFQMALGKFSAPLILKLNSSDEAVRSKEEGDTQLAVQEALSLMSQAYCNLDDTNRQLLEALLLHNVDKDEPQVLVHAATVFSKEHIPSRILMLGAGDLTSGNPGMAKEKCVTTFARGENGRKGPLQLLPGSEQFPETEVKHKVDFKDQDTTKTWLVRNLVAMFKTSNGSSKIVSSVLKTFIFLTLLCATNGLEIFEVENCVHYPGGRSECKIKQQETTQTTGIGEQVNLGELTEIAGSDKNVLISRIFNTLPYLDDEILARVYALCLEGKNAN